MQSSVGFQPIKLSSMAVAFLDERTIVSNTQHPVLGTCMIPIPYASVLYLVSVGDRSCLALACRFAAWQRFYRLLVLVFLVVNTLVSPPSKGDRL